MEPVKLACVNLLTPLPFMGSNTKAHISRGGEMPKTRAIQRLHTFLLASHTCPLALDFLIAPAKPIGCITAAP